MYAAFMGGICWTMFCQFHNQNPKFQFSLDSVVGSVSQNKSKKYLKFKSAWQVKVTKTGTMSQFWEIIPCGPEKPYKVVPSDVNVGL